MSICEVRMTPYGITYIGGNYSKSRSRPKEIVMNNNSAIRFPFLFLLMVGAVLTAALWVFDPRLAVLTGIFLPAIIAIELGDGFLFGLGSDRGEKLAAEKKRWTREIQPLLMKWVDVINVGLLEWAEGDPYQGKKTVLRGFTEIAKISGPDGLFHLPNLYREAEVRCSTLIGVPERSRPTEEDVARITRSLLSEMRIRP
jgi:hypothetical protein